MSSDNKYIKQLTTLPNTQGKDLKKTKKGKTIQYALNKLKIPDERLSNPNNIDSYQKNKYHDKAACSPHISSYTMLAVLATTWFTLVPNW